MNNFNDIQLNQVVENAEAFIKKRKSKLITTIDILAGILLLKESFAKEILESFSISLNDIEEYVPKYANTSNNEYTCTPLVDEILFESYEIAEKLNSKNVLADHLLLSLLTYDTGYIKSFLKNMNIDPYDITSKILAFYGDADGVSEFKETFFKLPHQIEESENKKTTKTLDEFCINMNVEAKKGKYTEAFTRETKIDEITDILCRRNKNNVCLVGEPGVGKTAIVEGLVSKIVSGNIINNLKNKIVYSLNMGIIISGTKYRGEFEERMQNIIKEAESNENVILFIDEIHTLVGTGGGDSSLDAANILKPALARGDIQVIGATTYNEYKKFIEKDGALERRFKPVRIEETSIEETTNILKNLISTYEKYHNIIIPPERCELIAKLSERYINDRFLPDKAIDLLDEACVYAINRCPQNNELRKMRISETNDSEIVDYLSVLNELGSESDEDKFLRSELENFWMESDDLNWKEFVKEEYQKYTQLQNFKKNFFSIRLHQYDIFNVLHNWTNIPVSRFSMENHNDLKTLETRMQKIIVGQEDAIKKVVKSIKRSAVGISNKDKPIGSFLFCGNTGVGKTYFAKILAQEYFNSEKNLITVDMTEFMESHSVSKLIGSPPGYVGYEEKGQLTEKIRKSPYSVVLFDEIEKAHPDIFNLLLRILDEGKITDSSGRDINFKNTIIIMTSNIGSKELNNRGSLGFGDDNNSADRIESIIRQSIKQKFKPEFINRLDDIIIFNNLDNNAIKDIIKLNIDNLVSRLDKDLNLKVTYEESIINYIASKNKNNNLGAREINRLIQIYIEDKLSDFILSNANVKKLNLFVENDEVIVKRVVRNGKKKQ